MGLGNSNNQVVRYNAMRTQSAILGIPIPIIFGQGRIAGKLIWYGDFVVKKAKQQGGKGLGKGGSQYVYSASVLAALAQGQINSLLNVWDSTGRFVLQSAAETYTVAGGTPSYTVANASIFGNDQGASVQSSYSVGPFTDYGSPGPVTLSGTQSVPMTQVPSSPGAGHYSVNPATGVYSFSTADNGKQIIISYSFYRYRLIGQEVTIIPFSGPFTVTVDNSSNYSGDQGVVYFPSGNALQLIGSGTPTVGQYKHSGATYTFAAADAGLAIIINYTYNDPNTDNNAPNSLNVTLVSGAKSQSALSYMTGKHPTQARGYTQLAYIFSSGLYLGFTPELPNYSYELAGAFQVGGGIVDTNPADCITALLTDAGFGAGFPAGFLGSLTLARQCWAANSFFISPVIENQQSCASIAGEWLEAGMVAAFFSEQLLKFVPYGDTTAVGNGVTYSPPTAPVANLTDDNFLAGDGEDPVKVDRSAWQDASNRAQVTYNIRANDYNPELIYEQDEQAISSFGLRVEDPRQWDFITTLVAAQYAASMRVQRSVYVRNTFSFRLPSTFAYLEPMDVVTITDPGLQLVATPVRITKIEDDPVNGLDITAEDFIWGAAAPAFNPKGTNNPFVPETGTEDPGDTNALIIEAPNRFALQQGNMLYGFVNGSNPNWGGCDVWISYDGVDYQKFGDRVQSPARIGELTANLASYSAANPDTTNTLAVKMNVAGAELPAASSAQAAQLVSLCAIVSGTTAEFLSYQNSSLVGAELYNLTTLYRGVLGSSGAAHSIGDVFVRIDEFSFSGVYDPSYVGKTIFFKFTSVNLLGNQEQDLSDVTAFSFSPVGMGKGAVDLNTGSILSITGSAVVSYSGSFSYTATTSSIAWSWSGLQIFRADGSVTNIPNSSQTITGLSASTTYFFYPYWDEVLQVVAWVAAGGVGTPSYAHTAKTNALAQAQALSNQCPLSAVAMSAATTASGGGGGTGGGSGSCLLGSTKVETRRGVVRIDQVKVSDELLGPEGWTKVIRRVDFPQENFIRIETEYCGAIVCAPSHVLRVIDEEGIHKDLQVKDLTAAHFLFGPQGITALKRIEIVKLANSKKVSLACEPFHYYFAGEDAPMIQAHNFLPT